MLDFNSSSLFAERVNRFADAAIADAPEEKRSYLGCSALGGPCERAAQYEALHAMGEIAGPQPDPRLRRIYWRGQEAESWCARWMRMAGFLLVTEDASTGSQFEVLFLDGFLRGHADGLLLHWRRKEQAPCAFPALWECKCLGAKGWRQLAREKLRKAYPKYYAQVQLYMNGLRLERCVLTALNADTMELHHELVPYDEGIAREMLARAERVRTACALGEMLPRQSSRETDVMCRFCNFSDICWRKDA